MANNNNLQEAKVAKKDEFYTQFEDIEREISAYLEYDENVFKDKVVLLPCDDPEWSNFTKYFAQNFIRLGLKKLISTSYAQDSKPYKVPVQRSLFELNSPQYDATKTNSHGKIFTLTRRNKKVDINDLKWKYLEGDGDFRSDEVKVLRDEADIIVTNPPFSKFREFVSWIIEADKKFVIIGHQNAIKYKEVFPLIMSNKIWLGKGFNGGATHFLSAYEDTAVAGDHKEGMIRVSGVVWFTNLEHGRRHQPLQLMTMDDNLRYNKKIQEVGYPKYDNFDALEVSQTKAIPSDYKDVMGVPITFLDKYCPDQFEILGITQSWFNGTSKIYPNQIQISKDGKESIVTKLNDAPAIKVETAPTDQTYYKVGEDLFISLYARILIKHKKV